MFSRLLCRLFICSMALIASGQMASAWWLWAEPRVYTCKLSANSVDFGTITDTELNGKSFSTKIIADCDRPFITGITLLPIPYGAYCVAIRGNATGGAFEGTRYLENNDDKSNKIYFSFYNNAAPGSLPIGEDFSGRYGYLTGAPYINLWRNFVGSFHMDFPVNVRLFNSRIDGKDGSIGAGNYSGMFQAQMYYGATYHGLLPDYWQANSAADCTKLPKGPVFGAFTVRAVVKSSCSVDVESHIDFGKIPAYQLRNGVTAPEGHIKARCSKGAKYQIGLSAGLHKDRGNGFRAMQRSGGDSNADFIAYDLYKDSAHTQRWTDAWGSGDTAKGEGKGDYDRYSVYASLPPQDTNKNIGSYQDTVRVEIRVNSP